MVGIGSIDGLIDIAPTSTGSAIKTRSDDKRPAKTDSVELSADAQQAAQAQKAITASPGAEIRQHVVDQARQRIEEGTYRLQNVVQLVAARVAHYVG